MDTRFGDREFVACACVHVRTAGGEYGACVPITGGTSHTMVEQTFHHLSFEPLFQTTKNIILLTLVYNIDESKML